METEEQDETRKLKYLVFQYEIKMVPHGRKTSLVEAAAQFLMNRKRSGILLADALPYKQFETVPVSCDLKRYVLGQNRVLHYELDTHL